MTRILVQPEELHDLSGEMRQTARRLRLVAERHGAALAGLGWQARSAASVEAEAAAARRQAEALIDLAEALARYLDKKARDFSDADGSGAHGIGGVTAVTGQLLRGLVRVAGGIVPAAEQAVQRWLSLGSLLDPRAVATMPVMGIGAWLGARLPTAPGASGAQAPDGAATAVAAPAPQPAAPAAPAPATDAFWQGVGDAPVVTEGGTKRFAPGFQRWADQFNATVDTHWTAHPDDHAGHRGAEQLSATYRLTPDKLEQLWEFSRRNHVDPRLMLSILKQEGTGSFDTNAANSGAYDGNGPRADWQADMTAALDGPILAKLRLYPQAVQAGFKGTWVQWINWHTPIDSPGFKGGAGVYAADINWGSGVEQNYRQVAQALGDGAGDPVQGYGRWMEEHAGEFQPRHIDGDFVIKPGLAPGGQRPTLALWAEEPRPNYPETTGPKDGFWWFPAPDEYCWHLEKK